MLHSMTAFGRGEAMADGYRFTVELRTLNHRFCDIRVRLPRKYSDFEDEVKKPACLIYQTDLMGDFPEHAPQYPVIWVSQTEEYNIPFGTHIYFDVHDLNIEVKQSA